MSHAELQSIIDEHSRCLMSGDHADIVRHYDEQIPIFIDGNFVFLKNHDELRIALALLREKAKASGAVSAKGYLTAGRKPVAGRFQFTADWHFLDHAGTLIGTSAATYFCQHGHGGRRIVMVEYQKSAFADLQSWSEFLFPAASNAPEIPKFVH